MKSTVVPVWELGREMVGLWICRTKMVGCDVGVWPVFDLWWLCALQSVRYVWYSGLERVLGESLKLVLLGCHGQLMLSSSFVQPIDGNMCWNVCLFPELVSATISQWMVVEKKSYLSTYSTPITILAASFECAKSKILGCDETLRPHESLMPYLEQFRAAGESHHLWGLWAIAWDTSTFLSFSDRSLARCW